MQDKGNKGHVCDSLRYNRSGLNPINGAWGTNDILFTVCVIYIYVYKVNVSIHIASAFAYVRVNVHYSNCLRRRSFTRWFLRTSCLSSSFSPSPYIFKYYMFAATTILPSFFVNLSLPCLQQPSVSLFPIFSNFSRTILINEDERRKAQYTYLLSINRVQAWDFNGISCNVCSSGEI